MIAIRGSDVFLKEDVRAMLEALLIAAQATGRGDEYTCGFLAGVAAVAVGLGIVTPDAVKLAMETGRL